MNIGGAIDKMRLGKRVARKVWEVPTRTEAGRVTERGYQHWLMLVEQDGYDILSARVINEALKDGNPLGRKPWIAIRLADESLTPYTATHTDLLAEDWVTLK